MLLGLSWTLTASGALITAIAARRVVQHRQSRRRARELERLGDDLPAGSTAHLSPSLAHLAVQARVVRLSLATPLQRYAAPLLHDTPWGRRAACDEYDLAISDARRALWEWLLLFRRLGEPDRQLLGSLGLTLAPFYTALFKPGVFDRSSDLWEETLYPAAPDLAHVFAELRRTMHDLRAFESTLLTAVADPYRR
jgi:hypothetical protein